MFQNLIGNAIKYRRPDSIPEIHVSAQKNDSTWTFSVADNGIGIEPKYLEQIFIPFKRLHSHKYPGTGLGLAMCQRIVERYNGKIWAETKSEPGSVFLFTQPVADGSK